MEYSPKKMQEMMEQNDFLLKKKINSIINKAEIDKNTLVIEIGPGAGSLTYKLAKYAKNVLCYEIDTTLKSLLEGNLKEYDNVEIKYIDFLESNVKEDIKNYSYDKLYVVANLPYYVTTPIIVKIIEDLIPVDKICVMVQKEVGDRFKAQPGSKDYGSLSVYINYYFEVKKLLDISRNVFIPKPNVDSIVVEFLKKANIVKVNDEKIFFKLIRDSFNQKRKTIRNNLKEYNLEIIESVLNKYNLDLSVRAEALSVNIFIDIANELSKQVSHDK